MITLPRRHWLFARRYRAPVESSSSIAIISFLFSLHLAQLPFGKSVIESKRPNNHPTIHPRDCEKPERPNVDRLPSLNSAPVVVLWVHSLVVGCRGRRQNTTVYASRENCVFVWHNARYWLIQWEETSRFCWSFLWPGCLSSSIICSQMEKLRLVFRIFCL